MFRFTTYVSHDIHNISYRVDGAGSRVSLFKKNSSMKIKIVSLYSPSFFKGDRLSAFADKIKFFIMYKKHWWQRYRYMKDLFGHPMKFDSQEEAEEYLEREGIDYKGKA